MNKGLFRVLGVRPFLYIWLAEVFSQIAMNMLNFVLIVAVFQLTNSSSAVSGIILTFTVPAILFGVIAGVFVDRINKRNVLLYTNFSRALLLVVLTIFFHNLIVLYIIGFLIFVVTQFFIPAETPIIPQIVPKELLLPANALFGIGIYASILIAYALSGPFIILLGERNTYIILTLFFIISGFFILLIKNTKKNELIKETKITKEYIMSEIVDTWKIIVKTKEIFQSIFLLIFFNTLILIIATIGPGYAKQILNISVVNFPLLIVTPAAIGLIVGALIVGHYFENFKKDKVSTSGLILIGITTLLLPLGSKVESRSFFVWLNGMLPHFFAISNLHFIIVLSFLLGIGGALIFVPSNTLIQEKTEDKYRGKIYGFTGALTGAFSLLPVIAVGKLSDIFGVGDVLTGLGVVILFTALVRRFL